MHIKKTVAGLAAGAALALFMSASSAQAGGAPVTVNPSPSTAGQSVTVGAVSFGPACASAAVEFRDITGGGSKSLCSATISGVGTVSCTTSLLTDVGARTINAYVVSGGVCSGAVGYSTMHTVNVAPTAVPTTSEWTLWGLTGLLLIGGGVFASRRFRATAA